MAQLAEIVLIEPQESMNIGSVARAMMNFGFSDLHLVNPRKLDRGRAAITACSANQIVDKAQIHTTLEDALSGFQNVVGLSAREGKNRSVSVTLSEWLAEYQRAQIVRTAILFGPEDSGLRQEHVEQCTRLISIPTHEAYRSMNLAQSVVVVLYELSKLQSEVPLEGKAANQSPLWNDFYQLDRLIDEAAERSGFVGEGTPEPVPTVLHNIFRRLNPNQREIGILLGLFGCIARTLSGRRPVS